MSARIIRITAAISVLSVILCFIGYPFLNRLIILGYAKTHGLTIDYKTVSRGIFSNLLLFEGLSATDNSTGMGLSARSAAVKIMSKKGFFKETGIDLDLNEVRFLKKTTDKELSYDSMTELALIPFHGSWTYRRITGRVGISSDTVAVESLIASGDTIGLDLSGTIGKDDSISSTIKISFSSSLVKNIPEMLSDNILKDEKDGWKSMSVTLKGNIKTPSIQVSGKMFRLTIGAPAA